MAKTRREQLEAIITEAKFKLGYVQTLGKPVDAKTKQRWQGDIIRSEKALAKLAAKGPKAATVKKPKAATVKFSHSPASEECECFECGKTIEEGCKSWGFSEGDDGEIGPFCTRKCARSLADLRKQGGDDHG